MQLSLNTEKLLQNADTDLMSLLLQCALSYFKSMCILERFLVLVFVWVFYMENPVLCLQHHIYSSRTSSVSFFPLLLILIVVFL